MHHKDEKRIAQLKRLILAEQSMLVIRDGCQKVLDRNEGDEYDQNERMLFSGGIATLYASPFTATDELGMLGEEFANLPDEEMQRTHNNLIYVRNKIYAHRDVKNATINFANGGQRFFQIGIVVDNEGDIHHGTPRLVFRAPQIENAARLASFQQHRLSKKAHLLKVKLAAGKIIKSGEFVLGSNFPPST